MREIKIIYLAVVVRKSCSVWRKFRYFSILHFIFLPHRYRPFKLACKSYQLQHIFENNEFFVSSFIVFLYKVFVVVNRKLKKRLKNYVQESQYTNLLIPHKEKKKKGSHVMWIKWWKLMEYKIQMNFTKNFWLKMYLRMYGFSFIFEKYIKINREAISKISTT